ncbi:MAG: transcriptional regulator [Gordonia sp.]|uniref:WhiB family transcriptional regulator n=1 Tax=Gordonia sp. (in: high G+C Gram-positive bacteria) TaxID=84139 RepID=UPI000C43E631|nr:WhiB family transcriptional regulator [Gordonia sp. (in: high G+C Gram-positive bacteria)]MAU83881.1 transcriptional regulator [Gordonia sp. (in: high G+C Gram-positive bacteria)]
MRGQKRREPGIVSLLAEVLQAVPALPDAACVGSADLFDPRANGEAVEDATYRHQRAAALCARCPVLDACRSWADTQPDLDRSVIGGRLPDQPGRPRKGVRAAA